jgi:outer membrane murein-binding lipoprotein Lpp
LKGSVSFSKVFSRWKSPLARTTIVLLLVVVVFGIALYHWWRPVFYALPEVAASLLVVVSAIALFPELQQNLGKPIRKLLFVLLSTVGVAGVVANVFQRSEQENRASSQNNQLSNKLERIEQSINRLVAEGKLTKEDAAKILSKASNLREGDHVKLSISFAGNENLFKAEVMCLVTDPANQSYWSGTLASGIGISGLDFSVLYPGSFKGAPPLRPGIYNITWIMAADSKQVIATDSFEIPVNR